MNTPLVPRPAATIVLLRNAGDDIEVFMLKRTEKAAFAGGAYVFPGGAVDDADHHAEVAGLCAGLDDATASRMLNLDRGGLVYWVTAVRECFEEAGFLLAYGTGGDFLALDQPGVVAQFSEYRRRLHRGELALAHLLREHKLRIAADRIVYFSHWITEPNRPRRFDTRFFIALAPRAQAHSHDEVEAVGHTWIRPAQALERHRAGEFRLLYPTLKTLEILAQFRTEEAAMQYSRSPRDIPANAPRFATGTAGRRILLPSDYAYAEVCKIDPQGTGAAAYEIVAGTVTALSPTIRRVTAPNAGYMTGPGTNTYLVDGGTGLAVIDPGPAIDSHLQAILAAADQPLRWILCTHTHIDHSPLAAPLAQRTGAAVLGMRARYPERQDASFAPARELKHGEQIDLGSVTLRVLHTPGHASNQVCYLHESERLLFTGDHIMQGSTVVINPPDGDMIAYLDSLTRLLEERLEWIAPGHGFLMDKPRERVERLLVHRMRREHKVIDALKKHAAASVEQMLPQVYDDVPTERYAMAARSLLAHLLKLEREGRAARAGGSWRLAG